MFYYDPELQAHDLPSLNTSPRPSLPESITFLSTCTLEPPQRYQHYKGAYYMLLAIARDCERPDQRIAVYRAEATGILWTRNLKEFNAIVTHPDTGDFIPRFRLIEPS